jgi:hypothetical protein
MTRAARGVAGWLALAVTGILVAAAVAYAASLLASPDVGLTSEPLSAGARLAPRPHSAPKPSHGHHRAPRTITTPAPAPPAPPARPVPLPPPQPEADDSSHGDD